MGQKTHPIGFRLGQGETWKSRWYAEGSYQERVLEDLKIRQLTHKKAKNSGIQRIEIERSLNKLNITAFVAKPGLMIGRGGQSIEELKRELSGITGDKITFNIEEVKTPDLSAKLVAENAARQIERRFAVKRVISMAADRVMERGAKGVRIIAAGRVGGATIARSLRVERGSLPLQTLRAEIDFARETAHTSAGTVGIKVWIHKGEREI